MRAERRYRLLPKRTDNLTGSNLNALPAPLTGHRDSAGPSYGIAGRSVLPSWSEGSPNTLREAMAAGVPVAATTVGGIPEMVTDGQSALVVQP